MSAVLLCVYLRAGVKSMLEDISLVAILLVVESITSATIQVMSEITSTEVQVMSPINLEEV
jgi:hypothetical protein